MKVFEKGGPENTRETCRIAVEKALELDAEIVASTTSGDAAVTMMEVAKELGYTKTVVFVTHTYGSRVPGENPMTPGNRAILEKENCRLVTATHLLSGAERGLSRQFGGVYPVELIASTLRGISAGTKVTVECAAMALDNGAIAYGKPVVSVGGTGKGLDTAVVMTPAHGNDILSFRIHEFLCKPW